MDDGEGEVDPFFPVQSERKGSEKKPPSLEKLEATNSALKKNISCLYKTAKLELQRRDKKIAQLQERISDLELMVTNQQNLLSGGLHLLASSYPELYYQQYYNSLMTTAAATRQPVAGTGKVAQGKNERSRSRSPQRRSHKSYVSKSHHSSRE